MVRAAGLRGLPALIDDLGGDGRVLFAAYGVDAGLVDTDDAVIPSMVAGRLLEAGAADRDCHDLGLRLAARQDTAILGPLAIAIENSATLGEALDCATRFLFVHSPALTIAQGTDPSGRPGVVGLRYGSTERDPMPPQVCDNGLGLLHRITVLLSGGGHARGVVIKGIDPERERRFDDALRRIVSGAADFTPDADGFDSIVVGQLMAEDLNIHAGDFVTLTSPEGRLTPYGMVPRSRRFHVAGVFNSGFYDYDANWVFAKLPAAQNLAGVGDVVSVLEFRVNDVDRAVDSARIEALCHGSRFHHANRQL